MKILYVAAVLLSVATGAAVVVERDPIQTRGRTCRQALTASHTAVFTELEPRERDFLANPARPWAGFTDEQMALVAAEAMCRAGVKPVVRVQDVLQAVIQSYREEGVHHRLQSCMYKVMFSIAAQYNVVELVPAPMAYLRQQQLFRRVHADFESVARCVRP